MSMPYERADLSALLSALCVSLSLSRVQVTASRSWSILVPNAADCMLQASPMQVRKLVEV